MEMDWLDRMRRDWDDRAAAGAERAIYTRDSEDDEQDFERSGLVNYNQLVRPYLPVLLDGLDPSRCCAVEIGCGAGRMTRWLAQAFGKVHGFDVSPRMIELARARLDGLPNVVLHASSGVSLEPLEDASADLVFSYIVFQHIPDQSIIEAYVREAARVLRPGGVFKFQVNGARPVAGTPHVPGTWCGVYLSRPDVETMMAAAGLSSLMMEGEGGQYFIITAANGPAKASPHPRSYVFPGEPWAENQLLSGFGKAVDQSWRPVADVSCALLRAPPGAPLRFFCGVYVWPKDTLPKDLVVRSGQCLIARHALAGPGDHFLDCEAPEFPMGAVIQVRFEFSPRCVRPPAMRCFGLYVPR